MEPVEFVEPSIYNDHPEFPGSGDALYRIAPDESDAEEFRRHCRRKGHLWPHTVSALTLAGVTPGGLWDALLDLGL